MTLRLSLAVAILLSLAGCSAVPFGGESLTPPGETLTPVAVETPNGTQSQTADPPPAPPGVSLDGAVDVRTLQSAHSDFLDGRSYTWMLTYDANSSGEGLLDRQFTRRVEVEGDRFLAEQFGPETSVDQTLYSDGSTGYMRVGTDNGPRFDGVADPGDAEAYAIGGELVWRYLTGVNLSVDVVENSGQTYYRLYSIDDTPPVALRGVTTAVTNYQVTAYVRPSGLVESLIVEYDRTHTNTTQHVAVRFDYNAIGRTSVSRPDWVDQVTRPPSETPTRQPSTATASSPTKNTETVTTSPPTENTETATNGTAAPTATANTIEVPTGIG